MMRLITYAQLKPEKGIGYSRVHLARLVRAGMFPRPIPLSDARIAWVEEEVDRWICDRCAARTLAAQSNLP